MVLSCQNLVQRENHGNKWIKEIFHVKSDFFCVLATSDIVSVEQDCSALLLTQQDLGSIGSPAFSYAAPAGVELRGRDQLAGIIGLTAERILGALVTKLVDCGADLGRIWPALKVKTMATNKFTARR